MSTTSSVDSIINAATNLAASKAQAATQYSENAQEAANAYYIFGPPQTDFNQPSVPQGLPPQDNLADKLQEVAAARRSVYDQELGNDFQSFLDSYFPNQNEQITALSSKLETMITEGGTALPPVIENAIWERGRERLTEDYRVSLNQATSVFAKRGFPMPPGALFAREQQARQDFLNKSSGFNRDVAIKQFETEIENLKFGLQQAKEYRLSALQEGIAYIRLRVASVLDPALEEGKSVAQAEGEYLQAVENYFRSLIQNGELALNYQKLMSDNSIQAANIESHSFDILVQARVEAAIAAARAMGDIASAALSSQNTLANIATETILSGSST